MRVVVVHQHSTASSCQCRGSGGGEDGKKRKNVSGLGRRRESQCEGSTGGKSDKAMGCGAGQGNRHREVENRCLHDREANGFGGRKESERTLASKRLAARLLLRLSRPLPSSLRGREQQRWWAEGAWERRALGKSPACTKPHASSSSAMAFLIDHSRPLPTHSHRHSYPFLRKRVCSRPVNRSPYIYSPTNPLDRLVFEQSPSAPHKQYMVTQKRRRAHIASPLNAVSLDSTATCIPPSPPDPAASSAPQRSFRDRGHAGDSTHAAVDAANSTSGGIADLARQKHRLSEIGTPTALRGYRAVALLARLGASAHANSPDRLHAKLHPPRTLADFTPVSGVRADPRRGSAAIVCRVLPQLCQTAVMPVSPPASAMSCRLHRHRERGAETLDSSAVVVSRERLQGAACPNHVSTPSAKPSHLVRRPVVDGMTHRHAPAASRGMMESQGRRQAENNQRRDDLSWVARGGESQEICSRFHRPAIVRLHAFGRPHAPIHHSTPNKLT